MDIGKKEDVEKELSLRPGTGQHGDRDTGQNQQKYKCCYRYDTSKHIRICY